MERTKRRRWCLEMTNLCLYCWRKKQKTIKERYQDNIPVCDYHFVKISSGGGRLDLLEENKMEMLNSKADKIGYESWEELKKKYQAEEEKVDASRLIGFMNRYVQAEGNCEGMVEAEKVKQRLRKAVNGGDE